jgi:hypothetical protein
MIIHCWWPLSHPPSNSSSWNKSIIWVRMIIHCRWPLSHPPSNSSNWNKTLFQWELPFIVWVQLVAYAFACHSYVTMPWQAYRSSMGGKHTALLSTSTNKQLLMTHLWLLYQKLYLHFHTNRSKLHVNDVCIGACLLISGVNTIYRYRHTYRVWIVVAFPSFLVCKYCGCLHAW